MKQKIPSNKIINQLLFFIFIILTSCSSIKYSETNKNYSRPVNSNVFTYKKRGFHLNEGILDTTKVYCNSYPADTPRYFDCYRFFANGRFLSYRFFGHIDSFAFADINIGHVGYYHIKDSIIRLQEFTIFAEHFKKGGGGKLLHHYGIISKDYIALDRSNVFSKKYFFKPKVMGIFSVKESSFTKYNKTNIEAPGLETNW